MDFFARQDDARRKTGLLLFYFCLAVALTIMLVYFLPVAGWYFYKTNSVSDPARMQFQWWQPDVFLLVCGITLLVVLCGAIVKINALRRGGGESVAVMLGGRQIYPDTGDFFEKRLRNIVEEMAIAAGIPVPPVYVLEHEKSINAFAAGFTPSDSVIAVTFGTMTGLTRDELQGVVAHEFSHILNSDTRMNITLMGIIHGLLIIGLTGRIILEFAGRGTHRRSSKNDAGKTVVFILAAGLILWIVGSCGMFFATLIKSAISRSRERLADAAAVQFTRNPAGLAGALKKIGGLSHGSRIHSPQAAQASHMYFGNGVGVSLFNTHPPLTERIRWLEPEFDGRFPAVTFDDLREQLARFENAPRPAKAQQPDMAGLFTRPAGLAAGAAVLDAATRPQFRPNNPEALIESIGAPMQHHAEAAVKLMDAIPEIVKEHARDPYGARALVFLLLLDADEALGSRQLAIIREKAEPEVFRALEKAVPKRGIIRPEMRLPIIDLSIPALRFLSPNQYAEFRGIIRALIEADRRVSLFEYALQRVLIRHLDPVFGGQPRRRPVNYYAIRGLERETSILLSLLARQGTGHATGAAAAFGSAVEKIAAPGAGFRLLPEVECSWEQCDAALDKFAEASFKVKRWLLGAALACLMHDRTITVAEVELFRAIADSLDCPVPPWVIPAQPD